MRTLTGIDNWWGSLLPPRHRSPLVSMPYLTNVQRLLTCAHAFDMAAWAESCTATSSSPRPLASACMRTADHCVPSDLFH